jgi:hypothetical protein
VEAHYTCNPDNSDQLLYYCPWGGTCNEDGTCQPDPGYAYTHDCGAMFGCDQDHCRMHRTVGQACEFNFDCESYCCSREANAVCLDGSDQARCKIPTAFYREILDEYTWHALPQDAQGDPHNLDQWWWEGGDHAAECNSDDQCDTGDCHDFDIVGDRYRCRLPSCIGSTEASDIRGKYFCDSAEQGHQAHINVVTNQAPLPDTPGNCVYEE